MIKHTLFFLLLVAAGTALRAQHLHLPERTKNALSGSSFAALIRDTALSLITREQLILKEVEKGNVPQFFRQFVPVTVLSNKIVADDKSLRVVIYGWHKPNGKAIQPIYNGHKYDWADYSHGVRLIQNNVYINGRKRSAKRILQSKKYHTLLSDEGMIPNPVYPVN